MRTLSAMDMVVLVWAPVDSSASHEYTLVTVAMLSVASLTLLVSALLMPGATATPHSTAALWAVLAFTPLVPLTATGPHRALASVMLTPMLSTPQSLPRVTPAGPVLLLPDSSPPATDADLASGLLMLLSVTPTGHH